MAFKFVKATDGSMYEPVVMPAAAETLVVGMALYLSSGLLTKAAGNVKATHICLENKVLADNGTVLCYEVTPQMIFEVPIEDIDTDYHGVGKIATFYTDGLQITDAAGGVEYVSATSGGTVTVAGLSHTGALIVDMRGAAADGDICWVKLSH